MSADEKDTAPVDQGVQAIDDDALEFATGGITLCSNPTSCSVGGGSSGGYNVNQTIYYQAT